MSLSDTPVFHVRLLGWPQVWLEEEGARHEVHLPGNKPQALLYYLLLAPGPVSRDTLTALLWPEADAHHARSSLRNALYQLQRRLPEGALQVDRNTVALAPRYRWDVDVHRLETLLAQPITLEGVRAMVALYRGDFLQGFHVPEAAAFSHWQTSIAQHLRTQLMDALDQGLRQALEQGRWPLAEELLAFAVLHEPWREDFHFALMQVLMWQGRYAAALKHYRRCCALLRQELEVEPTPALQHLAREIRRRRREPPPFRAPELPLAVVGREDDLARVCALLHRCRMVTLVGPSGVGKTVLALALAHRQRHRFAHGVFFIALEGLGDAEAVQHRVASALGLPAEPAANLAHRLRALLRERECLLILDDLAPQPEVARVLARWVQEAPGLHLVTVASSPLGLRREGVYAVRPLPYPPEGRAPPPHAYPAGQLVLALWERLLPFPPPGDDQARAVARLCRLLDGLPLALELAVIQLRHRPLEHLVDELEQDLDILYSSWPEAPDHHRSLRALFERLWKDLEAGEQQALKALSVFAGPFTPDEAAHITGLARQVLHHLMQRGLLQPSWEWPQGWMLHRVLRRYLQEAMGAHEHPLATRHARYYLRWMAGRSRPLGMDDARAMAHRHGNLKAACLWAVRVGLWDELVPALATWHAFYESQGWYREGLATFRAMLDRARGTDHRAVGRLYAHAAALAFRNGEMEQALDLARRAREQDPHAPLRERLFVENVMGVALMHQGRFDEALAVLHGVVQQAQGDGLTMERIKGLVNLCSAYLRTGRYQEAVPLLQQGLHLCREAGDTEGVGFFLLHLGTMASLEGRWQEAEAYLQEALETARGLGRRHVELHALLGLAIARALRGAPAASIARVAEPAVHLAQEMGDNVAQARARGWLAWAWHRQGRLEEAWRLLRTAMDELHPSSEPTRLHLMALAAFMWLAQGRPQRAAALACYVAAHPATEAPTRHHARRLLQMLNQDPPEGLPPQPPPLWPEGDSRTDRGRSPHGPRPEGRV